MAKLVIAGATVNQTPLDWKGNRAHILEAIRLARAQGVELLALPELCITGYGCEDMFLSEWVARKSLEVMEEIIPHTKDICVVLGLPLRYKKRIYNAAFILTDGRLTNVYCKRHLAREGVHYEPRWFDSWPEGKVVKYERDGVEVPMGDISFECKGVRVGMEICEDAWQDDRPADKFVDSGIDLILSPSASHFAFGKAAFREHLVASSSEKYDCCYLYTNLLGNESGRMIFDGDIILANRGEIIQRNRRLSFEDVQIQSASLDTSARQVEAGELNPWVPSQNEEFSRAASLALFDYLRKSRSRGFVLSLSGGADSSCCAVLVAEMIRRSKAELGEEKFTQKIGYANLPAVKDLLHCAYQGTKNSSEETLKSAHTLAESLDAGFSHWTIDEEVESFTNKIEQALDRKLTWEEDDITLQNIQARTRSPIIWMIANIRNCLLLTTSNRSEGDVGYTTMDGDTSGSLAPLAAVDKPFILQWLQWAEDQLGYQGLRAVNALKPSAELRPGDQSQTDEADLMPYPLLKEIEILAIRDKKSPVEIYQLVRSNHSETGNLLKASVRKFFRLWAQNQWKRERIAPSFHFDEFNIDPRSWMRFPILSSGFADELEELERCD